MLKIKESTKNHKDQLWRWLNYKDALGRVGFDLLKNDIKFVHGEEEADIGISWHGFVVDGVSKERCILMKNEPPIYNTFFGRRLNDDRFTKEFLTVMSSNKTAPYNYYYNIPRYEFDLVKEYFDEKKYEFLCMILRNKKWSYLINSLDINNRKYNKYSLLKFRKKADKYFCDYFGNKYHSFGGPWDKRCFKGELPGGKKWGVFARYQFTFCPENSRFWGYLCEKPIQPMCCGSIPIYYGAPDVEKYLPKGTFVDCRDFKNFKQLSDYIKNMEMSEYNEYVKKMKKFVTSEQADAFSSYIFAKQFKKILEEVN